MGMPIRTALRLQALAERTDASNKVWHDDVTARNLAIWEERVAGAKNADLAWATGLSIRQIHDIILAQDIAHQVVTEGNADDVFPLGDH